MAPVQVATGELLAVAYQTVRTRRRCLSSANCPLTCPHRSTRGLVVAVEAAEDEVAAAERAAAAALEAAVQCSSKSISMVRRAAS